MAKAGATKDYQFGQKNHWLRTSWNDVLRRLDGREQRQPILYLAGPQDNDRRVAMAKGVPKQNLIAIDRDLSNVEKVRANAAPAIHARVEEVLRNWPEHRPVAAVLLDRCGGLSAEVMHSLMLLLNRAPFRQSVILLNLQRGRDAESNAVRGALALNNDFFLRAIGGKHYLQLGNKHRALQFLVASSVAATQTTLQECGGDYDLLTGSSTGIVPGEESPRSMNAFLWFAAGFFRSMEPSFYKYQSGNTFYDSAIFLSAHRFSDDFYSDDEIFARCPTGPLPVDVGIARRIAATLAVRTKRIG